MKEKIKEIFNETMIPVIKLGLHSAAAVVGFVIIAILALLTIKVVEVVSLLGVPEIIPALHVIEVWMFWADIVLFMVVFIKGIIIFIMDAIGGLIAYVRKLIKEGPEK